MKKTKLTALFMALLFTAAPVTQASAAVRGRIAVRPCRPCNRVIPATEHFHSYRPGHVRRIYCHHYPYYRPYYRDYYYGYYDDVAIAGGIGLLLGAVIAQNNSEYERKQEEEAREAAKAKQRAYDECVMAVNTELEHVLKLINDTTLDDTLAFIRDYWDHKGAETFLDNRTNIAKLSILSPRDNAKVEYSVMKKFREVTVKASDMKYGVSYEKKSYYNEKPEQTPLADAFGIVMEDTRRDRYGCITAIAVTHGTPASFAGIKPGDSIIKIDTYDTRQLRTEQVLAYAKRKTEERAVVTITYTSAGGEKKTVEIHL